MRALLISFLALLAGCQVPSRFAMEGAGGRTSYNSAIQMTNSQQMLLNLVRLRYVDIPLFLDVSGVTTQFTYKTRVSPTIPIPGFNKTNPFTLGGELSWQDQPTISYAPLEGRAFSSRLLRPIHLSTIQQLIYSGWEINRLFLVMLQNFDSLYNVQEMSSPSPEKLSNFRLFLEVIDILRYFQMRGDLLVGVRIEDEGRDQPVEQCLQIVVSAEGAKAERLLELLPSAKKSEGKIFIAIENGFNERGRLGVMPRTILSCMYFLSQGVCIPPMHYEDGLVRECEPAEDLGHGNELLSPIFQVYCSFFPPKNAYVAVPYRDHWFYIDDCDIDSKKTFSLLIQLYNLHAEESKMISPPILTLPLK